MLVHEGVALLVLVNGGGRNATGNDLAKKAIHGASSLQERERFGLRKRDSFAVGDAMLQIYADAPRWREKTVILLIK
jgi:hypothetical protein